MSEERTDTTIDSQDQATPQAPETAPTETNGQVDELAQLRERVAALEKEAADYKDQWLRAAADYKNFKRRTEAERAELIRSASAGLLLKLLPVVDDFERALSSVTPEVAESAWFNGFRLIAQKIQTILESEGVTPIEALGQDFDPNVHEAVIYEPADGQEGKVVGELQKGYKLRDRVLRPTMVKVGQG